VLKKIIIAFLIFILFCGVLSVSANANSEYIPYNIELWVDNQKVETDTGYLVQNGHMLVPAQVIEMTGVSVGWEPDEWKIRITRDERTLTMYIANYQCANGAKVERMPAQPTLLQDTVMIPLRYVTEAFGAMVFWNGSANQVIVSTTGDIQLPWLQEQENQRDEQQNPESRQPDEKNEYLKNKIVVLDPGHGGKDPGAVAGKIQEKDLNLQVSEILKELLVDAGITVYMTRSDDRFVDLYGRAAFANRLKANLFVSIHHNASPDTGAQGVMTLYYPTSKEKSMTGKKFAQIVQRNMVEDLKARDWGIIPRPNLVVTRETSMPAVIAELGFMTSSQELKKLVTYEFQKKAAESLYRSIIEALHQQ
jgi:N-acetylmuramoyl-L-alanine amidase